MRTTGKLLACLALVAGCTDATDDASDGQTTQEISGKKVVVLRGVDRASAFSVAEAKRLKSDHGVHWTGVYIGGACDGGSGWTRDRVTDIAKATGWQFMPIWVGQQASSICGAHTLTAARGKADGEETVARMKQMGWQPKRDIPVALDVEAGTYFGSPSASNAYTRGWVNAVHKGGYRAYVYSTPFGLNYFHDHGTRIDAAWAASYFYRGFEKIVPGDLDQMGGRFRHKNRAWQYAGDFHVSDVGDVDADTSNLLLAPKPGGTNRPAVASRDVPASCGGLQLGDGLERGESVASCDGTTVLALGDDGELSLSSGGKTVWTAGTEGAGEVAVLEDNGELVVFDSDSEVVFTTETWGFPDAEVQLGDGALHVTDGDGHELWNDQQGMIAGADPTDADDEMR